MPARPETKPYAGTHYAMPRESERTIDAQHVVAVERADVLTDGRAGYSHELVDHPLAWPCKTVVRMRLELKAEQRRLDVLGRQQADRDACQMREEIRLDDQGRPWFAAIGVPGSDGDQLAPVHSGATGSSQAPAAAIKSSTSSSLRAAAFIRSAWRRHSAAKSGARVSGTQIEVDPFGWTG